ncbi:hypothetical protein [Aquibacillus rhizosphaerae]|uniref:Uncharacterized protein n=1 Tax=Aquibacillus rhizosphaerae TaxID=3051431 RepID=A0ABT7L1Y8_9BACI|nr:hypothetical protein [Aquibacillus sp. LR5S19]MDL4839849.1 hypothetical protein [Aquibacillus sp. LR5S19]
MMIATIEASDLIEGNKQVHIKLGEEYKGKDIKINDVSQSETTEIIIEVTESSDKKELDKSGRVEAPFVKVGLREINEPISVNATEGDKIQRHE